LPNGTSDLYRRLTRLRAEEDLMNAHANASNPKFAKWLIARGLARVAGTVAATLMMIVLSGPNSWSQTPLPTNILQRVAAGRTHAIPLRHTRPAGLPP